mmetsp:Transcript_40932/g.68694  ORF Transcript_40932/g.68694 Transcript_40932/m.68694 type:complete len:215 (+) Transcript_40932:2079-2723(+)
MNASKTQNQISGRSQTCSLTRLARAGQTPGRHLFFLACDRAIGRFVCAPSRQWPRSLTDASTHPCCAVARPLRHPYNAVGTRIPLSLTLHQRHAARAPAPSFRVPTCSAVHAPACACSPRVSRVQISFQVRPTAENFVVFLILHIAEQLHDKPHKLDKVNLQLIDIVLLDLGPPLRCHLLPVLIPEPLRGIPLQKLESLVVRHTSNERLVQGSK